MKSRIETILRAAVVRACEQGRLPQAVDPDIAVEEPKAAAHGDYATNLALTLASVQKMAPRDIARIIVDHIQDDDHLIASADIAGPGFINLVIQPAAWLPVLEQVHAAGSAYGACDIGRGQRVQVEFVSANPTGPLHVGHGRGAAVGDSVANILACCGYDVQKEYYINDSGRQIRTLGLSVYLRYRQYFDDTVDFPEDCYQGQYITDMAADIRQEMGDALLAQDQDHAVDLCARRAAKLILDGIRDDLADFGVTFDQWFSEQRLYDEKRVDAALQNLQARGIVYAKDGALWFGAQQFGDEKDRVVVRGNGQTTYFASDIAYHLEKYSRGFNWVIDVWGADHHGYIPRMRAAIEAGGQQREQFDVILVQLVNLLRGGQPVAMSTRAGEFVTLHDVVKEVGADAARFIFLSRHYESPLDFDIEVAKQKNNDNPVYYVQYVHARIASIGRKAAKMGIDADAGNDILMHLQGESDIQLIKMLARYPETVQLSGRTLAPHRITFYLMDLAAAFHSYYNRQRVLGDDYQLSAARLYLVQAVRRVIRNGLALLGVEAPERM